MVYIVKREQRRVRLSFSRLGLMCIDDRKEEKRITIERERRPEDIHREKERDRDRDRAENASRCRPLLLLMDKTRVDE